MNNTSGTNKWAVLVITIMSIFMASLDGSIVNVALPSMAKALGVTSSRIQLVATSYLIIIAGIVMIFGKLGDMIGKSRVFKIGLALFTFGSLLCGISSSFQILIFSRIIQAVGAAGTMATTQGVITEAFPATERGRALGFSGTAVALGALFGPGLGGLIVGAFRWEYIFLINVPIGVITMFYAFKLLPKTHSTSGGRIDIAGATLLMLTIVPLFGALSESQSFGFTNPFIMLGLAISVISFVLFVFVEKRVENPLVHLGMFKNKLFTLSIFCGFLSFVAMFCSNIIQPFYLQDVMSYTPQHSGLILMIFPVVLALVAPASGHLSDKMGSEILTFIGLMITSVGLAFMSTLNEASGTIRIMVFTGLISLGMGLFQSPNNSLIMSTVSRDKLGIAGSINALVRNLGMVTGISLATTLLYGGMSFKIGYRVSDYVAGRSDAFIFGMKIVYVVAAAICLIGAAMTFVRMRGKETVASGNGCSDEE